MTDFDYTDTQGVAYVGIAVCPKHGRFRYRGIRGEGMDIATSSIRTNCRCGRWAPVHFEVAES